MSEAQKPISALRSQILANPDVILGDQELMAALLGAGGGGGRNVVDLRSKLVERLEERLGALEDTHRTVIAAAYENLAGTNQIHRAVLELLDAATFRDFLTALGDEVANILSIDAIRLCLETSSVPPGTPMGPKGELADTVIALPKGGVNAYLSDGHHRTPRRVTLRRATGISDEIYGKGETWVQSEAVLRLDLGPDKSPGFLAMGSEDPQRFHPDQGTDLLGFFTGAFERMLRRWLA